MANTVRSIVSNQTRHNGGFARVEKDTKTGALYVTCSGCRTETPHGPHLAAALADLKLYHPGQIISG